MKKRPELAHFFKKITRKTELKNNVYIQIVDIAENSF